MIGAVRDNAVVGGAVGAGCGYVYGHFAQTDKKVAALAFAVFFAVYNVLTFVPLMIPHPNKQHHNFEALEQDKQKELIYVCAKQRNAVSIVTKVLTLTVTTLAFRHFELIGKRGTVVMSLACLYKIANFSTTVRLKIASFSKPVRLKIASFSKTVRLMKSVFRALLAGSSARGKNK